MQKDDLKATDLAKGVIATQVAYRRPCSLHWPEGGPSPLQSSCGCPLHALIHCNDGNGQPCLGNVCLDKAEKYYYLSSPAELSRLNSCVQVAVTTEQLCTGGCHD